MPGTVHCPQAVRAMNDPTALLNFWDRVQNAQAYVSALPTARGRAGAWPCVTPKAVLTLWPHLVAPSLHVP